MRELLNNDSLLAITERMLGKKIGKDNIYKIQQAGTKYVGHVYFDVADDFLYECIVQTTGTTNTTANFKKCGIGENRDKLDNLFRKQILIKQATLKNFGTIDISMYRAIRITHNFANSFVSDYKYLHTFDFIVTDGEYNLCLSSLWSIGHEMDTNQNSFYVYMSVRNGKLTPMWYTDSVGQNDDMLWVYGIL